MMKKLIALVLAVMLTVSCCVSALGENTKHERVYIVAGPDGEVQSLTVNIRLENKDGLDEITDASMLSDIQNMSGGEAFTRDRDALIWQAKGNDIIYQGTSDQAPAILPTVSLTLDGEAITAAELKNKTGEAVLTVAYNTKEPLSALAVTLLPLDTSGMTDIQAENAMILSEAGQQILVGYAAPGVDAELLLPDHFTVSFHVDHADLSWMITFLSPDPIRLACKEIDARVDVDVRSIANLASSLLTALKNGEDLPMQPGLQNIKTNLVLGGVNEFLHSVNTLDSNAKNLKDSAAGIADSAKALTENISEIQSCAETLQTNLASLQADSDAMNAQAEAFLAEALETANKQLINIGLRVQELTSENYAELLETAAKGQEEAATEEIAALKAYLDQAVTFVNSLKNYAGNMTQAAQNADLLHTAVTGTADGAAALRTSAAAHQKDAEKLQKSGTAKVKSTIAATTKQLATLALPYVQNDLTHILDLYEQTRNQVQNGSYDLRPDGMQTVTVYIIRTDLQ